MATLCEEVPNTATYPILSSNVAGNIRKQLLYACRLNKSRVALDLYHREHWIGVFVDFGIRTYLIYNSLRHQNQYTKHGSV